MSRSRLLYVGALLGSFACAPSDDQGPASSGGDSGLGGAAGLSAGGTWASGGAGGSSGAAGSSAGGVAGASGSGGASGTGGSGGMAGAGATAGTGATSGTGGTGGSGGVVFGDPFFGISPDMSSWGSAQLSTLKNLGAGLVRLQLCNWPATKAAFDAQVDAALAHGLYVYVELNYCLLPAYPDVKSWHAGFTDGGNAFAWAFATAAGEIAKHFAGRVKYYEIWNEPNGAPRPVGFNGGSVYWPTPATADWDGACGAYDYGTPYVPASQSWGLCPRQLGSLTTNAFMTIEQNDPAATVVAGNVLFHGDDGWVAKEYWKKVEQSPAVSWYRTNKGAGKPPWDVVGIHPYGYAPPTALDTQVASFQALVKAANDPALVAISEYGWHTNANGGDPNMYASEANQAAYVGPTFSIAKSRGLAFVVWFNYLDAPNDALSYGLRKVSNTGTPLDWKPGGKAFCQAAGTSSCPAP